MGEYRDAGRARVETMVTMAEEQGSEEPATGLYVHVPFCRQRCAYCNFAIVAGRDDLVPRYLELAERELGNLPSAARRLASVHLGGGTPSRLGRAGIDRLLGAVRRRFTIEAGAEIGLEANPEDVTPGRAAAWREAGITRVSVGVQALDPAGLRAIGRPGAVDEGLAALAILRDAAIPSLGADMIFGRPGQTGAQWHHEIDRLLAAAPDHVSIYALETDAKTPLVRAMERGEVETPDDDRAAAMYETAAAMLAGAGLPRYEISNFARAGHASRHNLRYWTDASYLGIGPSAASYWRGERWTNPRGFGAWARRVEAAGPAPDCEAYDPDRRAGEAIVFGLRLEQGVDLDIVRRRHGEAAVAARQPAIARLLEAGLLEARGAGRIALADRARLIADEVFVELL